MGYILTLFPGPVTGDRLSPGGVGDSVGYILTLSPAPVTGDRLSPGGVGSFRRGLLALPSGLAVCRDQGLELPVGGLVVAPAAEDTHTDGLKAA